jgi:hypothetical protein
MCLLITPSIDTARMALLFECREFYCAAGPVRADVLRGGGAAPVGAECRAPDEAARIFFHPPWLNDIRKQLRNRHFFHQLGLY